MRGIVNDSFKFVGLLDDEVENKSATFEPEDVFGFNDGDEVEILKVIETTDFVSGLAYVIFNEDSKESMTIDSMFITLVE